MNPIKPGAFAINEQLSKNFSFSLFDSFPMTISQKFRLQEKIKFCQTSELWLEHLKKKNL